MSTQKRAEMIANIKTMARRAKAFFSSEAWKRAQQEVIDSAKGVESISEATHVDEIVAITRRFELASLGVVEALQGLKPSRYPELNKQVS